MTCEKRFYMVQYSYYLVNFGLTQLPKSQEQCYFWGWGGNGYHKHMVALQNLQLQV